MNVLVRTKGLTELLKKLKVEENLQMIVIYLAEVNPNLISHKKLAIALKASNKDLPLVQYGTKDLMDYKENLKKGALADGKKVNILQEFLSWMVKMDYTLKDLFPGADL